MLQVKFDFGCILPHANMLAFCLCEHNTCHKSPIRYSFVLPRLTWVPVPDLGFKMLQILYRRSSCAGLIVRIFLGLPESPKVCSESRWPSRFYQVAPGHLGAYHSPNQSTFNQLSLSCTLLCSPLIRLELPAPHKTGRSENELQNSPRSWSEDTDVIGLILAVTIGLHLTPVHHVSQWLSGYG